MNVDKQQSDYPLTCKEAATLVCLDDEAVRGWVRENFDGDPDKVRLGRADVRSLMKKFPFFLTTAKTREGRLHEIGKMLVEEHRI